jgi:hypothetical protein
MYLDLCKFPSCFGLQVFLYFYFPGPQVLAVFFCAAFLLQATCLMHAMYLSF